MKKQNSKRENHTSLQVIKILEQMEKGAISGVKWAKTAPTDLFLYAYYKQLLDGAEGNINPMGYFIDPHLIDCIGDCHGEELRTYLHDEAKGIKDETIIWLLGWLKGVKLMKEDPDLAETFL